MEIVQIVEMSISGLGSPDGGLNQLGHSMRLSFDHVPHMMKPVRWRGRVILE